MGEGGCSPEYFMHHMSLDEADDYMQGLQFRYRNQWEQTRFLANINCKVLTGESADITFPWEDGGEDDNELPNEQEMAELLARAAEVEKEMNKNGIRN